MLLYIDPTYNDLGVPGEGYSATGGVILNDSTNMYWDANEIVTPFTDIYGLKIRGSGFRSYFDGTFNGQLYNSFLSSNQVLIGDFPLVYYSQIDGTFRKHAEINNSAGVSIRLNRPATVAELLLPDGTACTPYTGNDGKRYATVKIDTQV
jgi:hypothetical protein